MVNYVNSVAMYQSRGAQYGGGWYGWQHQNLDDHQWSAWNGMPAAEWPGDPHHFKREPCERDMAEMPSPARGDLASPAQGSPGSRPSQPPAQPRSPYEWMKKPSYQSQPNPGKTRTKDKYRVVYSDHQRLELEKEFHYSRYITIRRKAELARTLGLSERQVKIWFQNRRAKERKQAKKREEVMMKDKGDHVIQQAQLQQMLQHQQMQMMQHHYQQGVLPGVAEPLVHNVMPVPLM